MDKLHERRLWTARDLHIGGRVFTALQERGLEIFDRVVVNELLRGREVPAATAHRALGKTGEKSSQGDLWIADPRGEGLYLVCPARQGQSRPWTVVGWWRLSEFGRAVVGVREGVAA